LGNNWQFRQKTAGHSDCCYSFARNGEQKFKEVYALQESETIQQDPDSSVLPQTVEILQAWMFSSNQAGNSLGRKPFDRTPPIWQ
jgi:hypothetical protein